jgi:type IV pilus assembly protein PilA
MGGLLRKVRENQGGFSLIELLVVILIIAILAAIGIPIFLNQREKAHIAGIQQTLKNVATNVESWAVEADGDYSALDGEDADILVDEGYRAPFWATAPGYVRIEATETRYCVEAQHKELAPDNSWRRATYDSDNPRPVESPDVCPELAPSS